jgi:hypothetical protein
MTKSPSKSRSIRRFAAGRPPSARRPFNMLIDVLQEHDDALNNEKLLENVAVLGAFGQTMAVAISKKKVILDGKHAVHAMYLMGLRTVTVVYADGLSAKQIRALRRRTNHLSRAMDKNWAKQVTMVQLD